MLHVPIPELERALPDFIAKQRWYRAKARAMAGLRVADVIPADDSVSFLIVRIDYREGDEAHYLLPLSSRSDGGTAILSGLHDGLHDPLLREALLTAIACEKQFRGRTGELVATRTAAFDRDCETREHLESSVSRAEQSNSSIIFGQRYILKLFRKLEAGINPDIEIGRFLTERRFPNIPAVLGGIEYRPAKGEAMHAGILMQFVPNQGDAWKYTLDSLKPFFDHVNGDAPPLSSAHPLEAKLTSDATSLIGSYLDSARLLGQRTAEMHRALADAKGDPDFTPEPFTSDCAADLYQDMLNQAETTFDLLRDKQNMLSAEAAEDARTLIAAENDVRQRFAKLRDSKVDAVRIRHHGDYHLGQVLWTGADFMIIDFEGEPARPLAERRAKAFAMRDVAGMVRSFSYAGYAALPQDSDNRARLEKWAEFWGTVVSAAYLHAYFHTASNAPFVGSNSEEHTLLFDAFTLQKALYEVAYELNNRPDWVRIPLRGILNLISQHGRRTQFA